MIQEIETRHRCLASFADDEMATLTEDARTLWLFVYAANCESNCHCGDGTIAYFAATCDWQTKPEGDIRQPRKANKGGWSIRDGRKKLRQLARGRSATGNLLVQPKAGGRV